MAEFVPWPKTPRLLRDMVITEKIDGTNGAVVVEELPLDQCVDDIPAHAALALGEMEVPGYSVRKYLVSAQSRTRIVTPSDDNHGFATWVWSNATGLANTLGPGRHFGEWWGSGINRKYGLTHGEKRFSLFNVRRYGTAGMGISYDEDHPAVPGLRTVPVLYLGAFDLDTVEREAETLWCRGSAAQPGFDPPEGVVVYHEAARQVFKATFDKHGGLE